MTSKTKQKKMIKIRKERAHKANRKADQKRMKRSHDALFGEERQGA
ncbi:MAG: hypothetical protein M0036_08895 [Desulfobacteraceae bacterium]|nr:hypothetical protein [Desulfobacteraceae bacterium]